MTQPQEIAVVVGATGAMGAIISKRLAAEGLKVLAVARKADALASLVATTPGVVACVADISNNYLNIRDLLGFDKIVLPLKALDVITAHLG